MGDESGLIACGLTNNVDLVVTLTDELLASLLADRPVSIDGSRQKRADDPDQLLTALLQCVAAGEGIDLPVADAATQEWLVGRVSGRKQVGGTGAQAANTLSALGFPCLMHMTGRSDEQIAGFGRPELIRIADGSGLTPLGTSSRTHDPTMWHVALEYGAGLTAQAAGVTIESPAANRVIVSHDPVNSSFRLDPAFVDAVACPSHGIRNVLVSGYNQITEPNCLRALVEDTIAAARRWKESRADIFIHAELGAMPHSKDLAVVVESLGRDVSSIGMNADELRDLIGIWGIRPPESATELPALLSELRDRLGTPRVCVHTAGFAMSLTSGEPEAERDALLFASLVASTRARIGRFPTFNDLTGVLESVVPHPSGLTLLRDLAMRDGEKEVGASNSLVVVPTIDVPQPAATVGLGDSFTAGVLAMS